VNLGNGAWIAITVVMLPAGLPFEISPAVEFAAVAPLAPVVDEGEGTAWFGTALTELLAGAGGKELMGPAASATAVVPTPHAALVAAVREEHAPATILAGGGNAVAMRPAAIRPVAMGVPAMADPATADPAPPDLGLLDVISAVDSDSGSAVEEDIEEDEGEKVVAAPLFVWGEVRRVEARAVTIDVGPSVAREEAVDGDLEGERAQSRRDGAEAVRLADVGRGEVMEKRAAVVDGEAGRERPAEVAPALEAWRAQAPIATPAFVRETVAEASRVKVAENRRAALATSVRSGETNVEVGRESGGAESRFPDSLRFAGMAAAVAAPERSNEGRRHPPDREFHRVTAARAAEADSSGELAVGEAMPELPTRQFPLVADEGPELGGDDGDEFGRGRDNVTLRFREAAPSALRREVVADDATPEVAERERPVVADEEVADVAPGLETPGRREDVAVKEIAHEQRLDSAIETRREVTKPDVSGEESARKEVRQAPRLSAVSAGVILERQATGSVKTLSIRLPIEDGSRLGSAVQIDVARKNAVLEVRLTGSSAGLQQAVTESIDSLVQKLAVDRWSVDAKSSVEPGAEAAASPRAEMILYEGGDRLPRSSARAQMQENASAARELALEAPASTSSSASSSQQSGDRQQSSSMEHDSGPRDNANQQQAQQEEQRRPRREAWNQYFRAAEESFEMELVETAPELQ
jgi:hypothetical protein